MSHTISIMGFGTHSAKLSISATADTKEDARKALDDVANALNNRDRLTAEVKRLEDVLHSIYRRAELAETDGVHMRGALGNIKDDAAKALNPEEPT